MISNMNEIRAELMELLGENDKLMAEDVLAFAKSNPRSAIREAFDRRNLFNDRAAANIARLDFARSLIQRVRVRYITATKEPIKIRGYVNLSEERTTEDRGYRLRTEVISHEERCAMLKREFVREVDTLIRRFADVLSASQIEMLREVAIEVSTFAEIS